METNFKKVGKRLYEEAGELDVSIRNVGEYERESKSSYTKNNFKGALLGLANLVDVIDTWLSLKFFIAPQRCL